MSTKAQMFSFFPAVIFLTLFFLVSLCFSKVSDNFNEVTLNESQLVHLTPEVINTAVEGQLVVKWVAEQREKSDRSIVLVP